MRFDRSISLGLVQPLQRAWTHVRALVPVSARQSPVLPILMYHSISDTTELGISEYYHVCTSPRRFAEQMESLATRGWRGVSLREGLTHLQNEGLGNSAPKRDREKLFAITFDDGFRDFHTAAFPVLHRHGFSATMYLPTAFINKERRSFKDRECLTWSEVRELHRAGVEFGSHTVNHPNLVDLPWAEIRIELQDSKTAIERELGETITAFGYPYAFPQAQPQFVRDFRALLAATGYLSSVTTAIGRAHDSGDRLCLPRLPANSADDASLLEAKLTGAYDWVAFPQRLHKLSQIRSARPRPAHTTSPS